MLAAGRELFGDTFSFDGVEVSGRLDVLIWNDLARLNGIDDPDAHHATFRSTYRHHLVDALASRNCRALNGVHDLIKALTQDATVRLGLLTGNYPETGRLKVKAAGLSPDLFAVCAWGDDAPTRRDLPPVAMQRYYESFGSRIEPERIVIIGDTPHDVDCAMAHGCRSLAVATGRFELDDLIRCGPDMAVSDLSQTDALCAWLLGQSTAMPTTGKR